MRKRMDIATSSNETLGGHHLAVHFSVRIRINSRTKKIRIKLPNMILRTKHLESTINPISVLIYRPAINTFQGRTYVSEPPRRIASARPVAFLAPDSIKSR